MSDNMRDLSQMSDFQSISRISRANCSRILGRIDSLPNLFDHHSSVVSNPSKSAANHNQGINHLEKTAKSLTCCEDSISEHIKCKVVLDSLKDVATNTEKKLHESVADKLKGLVLIADIKKYMYLPPASKNVQEELNTLGIADLPKYDMSCTEMLDVKCCVEARLREKIQEFISRYERMGGSMREIDRMRDCNTRKKMLESHDIQVLQWKDKIEDLCTQYKADVLKCKELMNKWYELKYKDTNLIYLQKAEYLLLQAQVAEVQAKIAKLSCITKMFKETPVTIDAFTMLNSAIDEKLFTTMSEIRQKEELKQSYENLKNTEYEEVLKSYLEISKAIEKKKQILGKL